MRTSVAGIILGFALWLLARWVGTPALAEERPNILFLFADDQRPDTIGEHGNPYIRTPHLDQLVRMGFSFRRNYCLGSTGGAVCLPSRAMLMAGRTLYHVPTDLEGIVTLPQQLREHGYTTFGTGKWHNREASFVRSFSQGKAVFLGGMSDHTAVPVKDLDPHQGALVNQRVGEKFSSELFADAAVEFLTAHDGEQPFFCYVSFTAPHDPRQPPLRYRQPYYDLRLPLPANFKPQHPFHNGWMTGRDESLAPWPRSEEVVRDQLAEYYGMITHLDDQIGRILAALRQAGHGHNTLIVYSADHGLAVGSHGLLGKQNLYEQSMGCPLIFVGPGIPAGCQSQAFTYLHDIFPTVCDLAGVPVVEGVEGQSLKPIWEGTRKQVRQSLFTIYEDKMRAVRLERWKLIRYPLTGHTQLFDLAHDPHELHNLAQQPEQAERVQQLLDLVGQWQRKLDDPHPLSTSEPEPLEIDLSGRQRRPDRHQPSWIVQKYFPAARSETQTQAAQSR